MSELVFNVIKSAIKLEISNKVVLQKNKLTILFDDGSKVQIDLKKIA